MLNSPTFSNIRALHFFSDLDDEITKQLLGVARVQRFGKHARIVRQGDRPKFLPIVVDGLVGVFTAHNGQETTTEVKGPGSTLFLAAVLRDTVSLNSARTLAPSQIIIIPAQEVRNRCERDPAVARAALNDLADHFSCTQRALMNMKLRSSAERLANWILKAKQDKDGCIEFPFDKRTLASCLGMSAENLSRNLRTLAKHGLRNSGQKICVEDRAALLAFAKPNDLIDHEPHLGNGADPEAQIDASECRADFL